MALVDLTSSLRLQGGATAADQSEPAGGNGDQAQHERRRATDDPVTGARTTVRDNQIQPTIDRSHQAHCHGHDGPAWPGRGAETADRTGERDPTDNQPD